MSTWAIADAYEPYVGRWSRLVARELLAWLSIPAGCCWLDVACGTGALSETILGQARPGQVRGLDRSEGFVASTSQRVRDARAAFVVGDALSLPFADGEFDATVSGLMLNFLPDPGRGLAEMARVTRPDGTVSVYLWDYAGEMQLMRHFWDAAAALDPAALELDEGRRFPLCRPEPLEQLFRATGLQDVTVRPIDVPTLFRNFDDYWSPFLGGQGPAPGYTVALDEPRRATLRDRLQAALPIAPDGSISLTARAWAARGRVAGRREPPTP